LGTSNIGVGGTNSADIRIDATPEKRVLLIFARKASFFILTPELLG
jgi:hypothetical protein